MNNIWRELDKIDLEEQAKFTDENNLKGYYIKHPIEIDGVLISEEQYNQMCDALTKSKASYIGSNSEVQGYIRQDGRKVKFRKFNNKYEFGVYVGDDSDGSAITYFIRTLRSILEESNPYSILIDGNRKYKSDLNGEFKGLDKYMVPSYINSKDYEKVRNKIIKGESLI